MNSKGYHFAREIDKGQNGWNTSECASSVFKYFERELRVKSFCGTNDQIKKMRKIKHCLEFKRKD